MKSTKRAVVFAINPILSSRVLVCVGVGVGRWELYGYSDCSSVCGKDVKAKKLQEPNCFSF